jgi:ATP/maltotriose-dependent transcriptional regulator MalT
VEAILEQARGNKLLEELLTRAIAGFYGMQGRFDEARALLTRARSTLEELGRPLDVSTTAFFTGPLELLAGDPAAAERELRAACDALESSGEKGWLSTLAAFLAEALYVQGRLDEAAAAVRRSREAATSDDHNAQAFWRSVEAKILARQGKLEEAERLVLDAVAVIDRTDELNHQADVRMALAEVLQLAQRPADAISVIREGLHLYEQKGNLVSANKARALLSGLSTAASPSS